MSTRISSLNEELRGAPITHALAYLRAGFSVVPIRTDGSKEPALKKWKPLQRKAMGEAAAQIWWHPAHPPRGLAVIGGKVSGGAECFDFDAEAGPTFDAWQDLVEGERPGLLSRLALVRTPAGIHAWLRSKDPYPGGPCTLAKRGAGNDHDATLIQTRGEGCYALVPGCPAECHPTKGLYVPFGGVALTALECLNAGERSILLRCARSLDRCPDEGAASPPGRDGLRPGDEYDVRGPDWAEILVPAGWSLARSQNGVRYWKRPGKTPTAWGATTGYCRSRDGADLLRVWTCNAPPFAEGQAYGKFRALALLRYKGDFSRCARECAREGYGRPAKARERSRGKSPPQAPKVPEAEESSDSGGGATQVQRLMALAGAGDLFHDSQLQPWVAVPPQGGSGEKVLVLPVSASGLGQWLRYRLWAEEGGVPSSGSVDDALKLLQAQAVYQGKAEESNVRLAGLPGGNLALDLGDETYRCVLITDEGWSVGPCPAARFWRPRGLRPLPVPKRNGTLGPLWAALNVGEVDRVLVAAWLLGALHPGLAYPLLCIHGEEGSGKTIAAGLIRQVIDPNACPLRAPPHGEENLLLACRHSRIVAIDNVSSLERGMPDSLCRVSTGAGLSRRSLFTDQEETCLSLRRPVLLNGIPEVATSSDLASRAITIECPPIRGEGRRGEEEIQREFEASWPAVLGCLLDATTQALARLPDSNRIPTGRLADWERWVDAGETAMGFTPGTFAQRWEYARRGSTLAVLESSAVADVVRRWFDHQGADEWQGSPSDLLGELKRFAPKLCEAHGFPGGPSPLSRALKRLAPSLRVIGLDVATGLRVKGHDSGREVRLARSK